MPGTSPFADDWRDCLRAHYTHVVRAQDTNTIDSLTTVLHQVGFSKDEISDMFVRATMHVDDVGKDFVPDEEFLVAVSEAISDLTAEPPPEALVIAAEEAALEIENQPEEPVIEASVDGEEPPPEDVVEHDPDGPQQMSLF